MLTFFFFKIFFHYCVSHNKDKATAGIRLLLPACLLQGRGSLVISWALWSVDQDVLLSSRTVLPPAGADRCVQTLHGTFLEAQRGSRSSSVRLLWFFLGGAPSERGPDQAGHEPGLAGISQHPPAAASMLLHGFTLQLCPH